MNKLTLLYTLKNDAKKESYIYFDKNIRHLNKKINGEIDETDNNLSNNDIDAFRHAYVSGRYVQVFNERIANIVGLLQEFWGNGYGSNSTNPNAAKNMDLWNNAVGRKYGKKAKTKEILAKKLNEALKNGELIIDLNDMRKYEGKTSYTIDHKKPVIVLEEKTTGRNEKFIDLITGDIFDRNLFIKKIQSGRYQGYRLANINGIPTPISNPDSRIDNNLG